MNSLESFASEEEVVQSGAQEEMTKEEHHGFREGHEGGPSAYRAAWLQEKMGNGIPIIAESGVAQTLSGSYPDAYTLDSGFDHLFAGELSELSGIFPDVEWAIVARGGSTPEVVVRNLRTGDFLVNDQSIYTDEAWKNDANPFAEKVRRIKEEQAGE
jgi:hypothetical protein